MVVVWVTTRASKRPTTTKTTTTTTTTARLQLQFKLIYVGPTPLVNGIDVLLHYFENEYLYSTAHILKRTTMTTNMNDDCHDHDENCVEVLLIFILRNNLLIDSFRSSRCRAFTRHTRNTSRKYFVFKQHFYQRYCNDYVKVVKPARYRESIT